MPSVILLVIIRPDDTGKQVIMCTNDQKGDLKLRPTKAGTVKIGHGNGKIVFGFNIK